MTTEGWTYVALGDLVEIRHGYAFKGEYFRNEPTGNILLTPGNFAIGGGFKEDKRKFYDGPIPEEFLLQPGDLLVSMTDLSKQSDTLGYPAFVPSNESSRYLHNQRLGKVVLRQQASVRKDYLYYVLRTAEYRHEIVAGATGTTVKHTSPSRIYDYKFQLPPLDEQRVIASVLNSLDDKIELNRRMNETLEETAEALFNSWFIDFDPVRANMEARKPYGMDDEAAALLPDSFEDSPLGEIPRGWSVEPLDRIAHFLNGLALQKYPPEGDEYLPVIKIAELRKGVTSSSGRASAKIQPQYVIKDGDVLFSWSGSLEVQLWTGGQGALNQHLFKVTSETYPKWFYYYWIKKHLSEFRAIAADKATTMGHIKRQHLNDALTVVPEQSTLHALGATMEPIVDKVFNNDLEARAIAAVRDALLPKLLSGEIRLLG